MGCIKVFTFHRDTEADAIGPVPNSISLGSPSRCRYRSRFRFRCCKHIISDVTCNRSANETELTFVDSADRRTPRPLHPSFCSLTASCPSCPRDTVRAAAELPPS